MGSDLSGQQSVKSLVKDLDYAIPLSAGGDQPVYLFDPFWL